MKKIKKKNLRRADKIIVTFVGLVLIAITAVATKFALGAVDANISATINPGSLNTEQQAVVTVTANTGSQPVNVARARVTYDATKWQFVSADFTGAPFVDRTPEPPAHQGSGYYEVTGYKLTGPFPSGTFLIGKVVLKAIGTASSTAINVDQSNSELYSANDGSPILGSVTGTVATINAPTNPGPNPTPPSPSPTPPSSSSTKKSTGSTNTTTSNNQSANTTPTDNTTPTETDITETTTDTSTSNSDLAKKSITSGQSNLSRYKVPILVGGLGLLLAAGATYGLANFLHRRNSVAMGTTSVSSSGLGGAVIGSGLYGPQPGVGGKTEDQDPSDPK